MYGEVSQWCMVRYLSGPVSQSKWCMVRYDGPVSQSYWCMVRYLSGVQHVQTVAVLIIESCIVLDLAYYDLVMMMRMVVVDVVVVTDLCGSICISKSIVCVARYLVCFFSK